MAHSQASELLVQGYAATLVALQNRTPHEAFLAWQAIQLSEAQMSKFEGSSTDV